MPLGWERINVKKPQPNKNIVFIKPLPGPTEPTSKDFLERIAAQCHPIMNKYHLAVTSLEEYEPNLEFWGRNFNNGEAIQLVLRSPSTGRWLPFRFVQMVMMHELAHNRQMNHSKAFWAVRNEFSTEMKGLWEKGYTGDGLWGRGVLLENGAFARDELDQGEVLPEHMCGGTYKSRGGKKRQVKLKITYKERQERRIKKKFGVNGTTLGADEETKIKLEKGKKPAGKPRVAGSARGRELRAAAALARFDVKEEEPQIKDEELVTDSETESDQEDEFIIKKEPDDAIDINGKRLLDCKGHGMVKVCEDEDKDNDDAKRELLELRSIPGHKQRYLAPPSERKSKSVPSPVTPRISKPPQRTITEPSARSGSGTSNSKLPREEDISAASETETEDDEVVVNKSSSPAPETCLVCSVINDSAALTCMVCSNVLKPDFVPDSWHCKSSECKTTKYANAGDVGVCGICGTRKNAANDTLNFRCSHSTRKTYFA